MASFSELGIQVQRLEIGRAFGLIERDGNLVSTPITVRVVPKLLGVGTFSLLWQATGDVFEDFSDGFTIPAGEKETVSLPYVDQDGFRWGNQAVKGWYYEITATSGSKTRVYTHAPRLADNIPTQDLDTLVIGQTVTLQPAFTPAPYVIYNTSGGSGTPGSEWTTDVELAAGLAGKVNTSTYVAGLAAKVSISELDALVSNLIRTAGTATRTAVLDLIGDPEAPPTTSTNYGAGTYGSGVYGG